MMYSLILTLAMVGGTPPTDKADFNLVGTPPPVIQTLSKDDFCLVPPEVPVPAAPPVVHYAPAPTIQYVPMTYTSPYMVYGNVYGSNTCTTGNCPTSGVRFFRR